MNRIIVVGDAILDVYREYTSIRHCHGAPVVRASGTRQLDGGAAAAATMCRVLGAEVVLVTGNVSRKVRREVDGVTVFREDFDCWTDAGDVIKKLPTIKPTDIVLVSDYGKGSISQEVIDMVCARSERVIVDPYPGVHPDRYRRAWVCCPNWPTFRRYPDQWQQRDRLCVKMDERGCMVVMDGRALIVPAWTVTLVDSCAAGDQWIAALAVSIAGGADLCGAARIANVASALKCGKVGATPVWMSELLSVVQEGGQL